MTWDGQHGTSEKAAVQVLAKGDHPLEVTHVYDALSAKDFSIDWKGPGFVRQPIPLEALRVLFDGDQTVDSATQLLQVTGRPVSADWTVRNVGDAKAAAGIWQTGDSGFRFFGSGTHTVTRRISGDFTATCRVDGYNGYNGSNGEPVNARAWVGLTAREHGERLNWEWGRDFHLVQTARDGLRASADFTDFGAGRITSHALLENRPWQRIMRQGDIWTEWTSADARKWELGAYQYKKTEKEMDAGLFFSALPQDARAHFHARVSAFTIEPGAAADSAVPEPVAATHTGGDRFTGVVMARSDSAITVLRSTSRGLLVTRDSGKSWTAINGDLKGEDLAVRSVAIHPENPAIMVRAGGRAPGGRLWKTTDGGRSWTKLVFEGDFDGSGPSALCGEVLAICSYCRPVHP